MNIKSNVYENFTMKITKGNELMTIEMVNQLKEMIFNFYHNDLTSKLWVFDFKINDVWFEFVKIENDLTKAVVHAFK